MRIRRWSAILLVLLLPIFTPGQKPDGEDAAKEARRKLMAIVEQSLIDIQALRLPENRAYFSCQIGNVLWPQDKERARTLFQNAATELIGAQELAESKRSSNPNNELLTGGSTRQQILGLVASRDAELALDLLVRTRPAAIQKALLSETQQTAKISNYSRGNNYLAQNEKNLEQNFYRMAAEQSPERAAKLLKESLSKGLAGDTYHQLSRLAEKDEAAASEIGAQVVDKLLGQSYMADDQPLYINIQITQSILSHQMSGEDARARKLTFNDPQVRKLAEKFVSAYLSDPRTAPYIGPSIVGIAEKYAPSSVGQLKKAASIAHPQHMPSELDAAYQKLMEADSPAEHMLAAANKFPYDRRRDIYQTASNKFLGRGDVLAARAVLDENFTDEAREQMLNNFDNQNAHNLIGQGKFGEAELVIDGLPDQQRVGLLVYLANSVFQKDQKENKTAALALLGKAGQLTSENPENSGEMNMLNQVITGYSNIDPAEAIRIFEGLVPKINELTDAAAILNGFQNGSNVRNGEFIMAQGHPFNNYGADSSMIGSLSRFDFDRTMRLIDRFSRHEMRVSLRLQVAASTEMTSTSRPIHVQIDVGRVYTFRRKH